MMKRRLLFGVLLIMMVSVVLAGCAGSSDDGVAEVKTEEENAAQTSDTVKDSDENTEAVDETESAEEKEPVTIEFMSFWSYVTEDVVAKFEEDHPHITVNIEYVAPNQYGQKVRLLSSTEELPDVFAIQTTEASEFIEQGLIKDMKTMLTEPAYDRDDAFGETIIPALLEDTHKTLSPEQYADGQQYLVPFGTVAVAVVYNKTMFDELNITEPATWSEFISNNEIIKDAGYIPMSFTGKNWPDWWYRLAIEQNFRGVATGEDFASGAAKWTDPQAIAAFETVKQMWDLEHFDPGGFTSGIEESQALFVQGRMAQFYVVPENFVTYLIDNVPADMELGAYPLPSMVDGVVPKGLGGAPNMIAINSTTEKEEAAELFVKYLVSETMFQQLAPINVVPSITDYTPPATNPLMKAFAQATENGFIVSPYNSNKDFSVWLKKEGLPEYLLTGMDTNTFVEKVQSKYEELVLSN